MITVGSLLSLQCTILIMMLTGFILKKLNIIEKDGEKCLSNLIMFLFMPSSIIYSFATEMNINIIKNGILIIMIGFTVQIFALFINKFIYRRYTEEVGCILKYGTLVSNGGLIGIPIIDGLFGSIGILYANIYLIPQRIFIYTAGISLFKKEKSNSFINVFKKTLRNPTIIAIFIGAFPSVFNLSYPLEILAALNNMGKCTSSISLILVGSMLGDINWRNVISIPVLHVTINRLIIIPLIVLFMCRFLEVDNTITWIAVLLIGMPVASTCAVLAKKYDQDYKLAAKTIFVSTVLSIITLPLLTLF